MGKRVFFIARLTLGESLPLFGGVGAAQGSSGGVLLCVTHEWCGSREAQPEPGVESLNSP